MMIEKIEDNILWSTKFLSLYERTYQKDGKDRKHFMASRSDPEVTPTRPDAVIIVAFHNNKLVVTDEYRICIGSRELGFPAGLIDQSDWDQFSDLSIAEQIKRASFHAAERELHEETGLVFTPYEVSPLLFSSAGMTNESVTVVHGIATGELSQDFLESSEDIKTMLLNESDLKEFLLLNRDKPYGKHAWGMLWAFNNYGYPEWSRR